MKYVRLLRIGGCAVRQVAFVPDTHYAFSVGKDGLVKYWDADRWEHLLTLEGHKAEVGHLSHLTVLLLVP